MAAILLVYFNKDRYIKKGEEEIEQYNQNGGVNEEVHQITDYQDIPEMVESAIIPDLDIKYDEVPEHQKDTIRQIENTNVDTAFVQKYIGYKLDEQEDFNFADESVMITELGDKYIEKPIYTIQLKSEDMKPITLGNVTVKGKGTCIINIWVNNEYSPNKEDYSRLELESADGHTLISTKITSTKLWEQAKLEWSNESELPKNLTIKLYPQSTLGSTTKISF